MAEGSRHGQGREVREVDLARARRKLDRLIGGIELSSTKQPRRYVLASRAEAFSALEVT